MSVRIPDAEPDGVTVAIRGAQAIVIAVIANTFLLSAVLLAGVVEPFEPLEYPSVVVLTALGVLGATVVYWLLVQWKPDPDQYFVWVAVVVLLVSFIPDIGLLLGDPAATIPGVAVLMAMHTIAAAVSIAVLTEFVR